MSEPGRRSSVWIAILRVEALRNTIAEAYGWRATRSDYIPNIPLVTVLFASLSSRARRSPSQPEILHCLAQTNPICVVDDQPNHEPDHDSGNHERLHDRGGATVTGELRSLFAGCGAKMPISFASTRNGAG